MNKIIALIKLQFIIIPLVLHAYELTIFNDKDIINWVFICKEKKDKEDLINNLDKLYLKE
jgi:hypothetical protein